jgi:hypothetical protein
MTEIRRITRLLLTLYVVSYVSLIVPLHMQAVNQSGCCSHVMSVIGGHDRTSVTDQHDHSRCQICLTGGAVHTIPLHIAINTDLPLVGMITPSDIVCRTAFARRSSPSRAPPVVS